MDSMNNLGNIRQSQGNNNRINSSSNYQNPNLLDIISNPKQTDKSIYSFNDFKQWINNVDLTETIDDHHNQLDRNMMISKTQIYSATLSVANNDEYGGNMGNGSNGANRGNLNPNNSNNYDRFNNHNDTNNHIRAESVGGMKQLIISGPPSVRIKKRHSGGGMSSNHHFDFQPQNSILQSSAKSSRSFNGYEQINQYELKEKLGKGSFSEVYLGIDVESDAMDQKKYAIKIMQSKLLKKKFFRKNSQQIKQSPIKKNTAQFLQGSFHFNNNEKSSEFVNNEIAILKKMDHRYITKLYEVIIDREKGKAYLVLQFCPNGFINQNRQKDKINPNPYRKLSQPDCQRYFKQLALAVHYIHTVVNIAHRDIKPENILISENDQVRLSDFGLGTETLLSDQHSGTRLFMPPESSTVQGKKVASTQPADIWAMGVTLLILIQGAAPEYKDGQITNIEERVQNLTNVSNQLKNFLRKCLQKNPESRLNSNQVLQHQWISGDDPLSILIQKGPKKNIQFAITSEQKNGAIKEKLQKRKNNLLTLQV